MKHALLLAVACASCCCPKPVSPDRVDASETDIERASGLDACARAGKRLEALKCAEARPDFADFCRTMTAQGVPLCPTKISRIATCAEVQTICR